MASRVARRTSLVAGLAAAATVATSFAGAALGAPAAFSASGITTNPAPDSNKVVHANRPEIIASFSDTVASGSITLTEKGTSANLCSASTVQGKTVHCTPAQDLSTSKTYDAVGHATSNSGAHADTSKLEFTVDYPELQPDKSSPAPGGSIVKSEKLTAQFDEPIAGDNNSFQVFEVNPDGTRGTGLGGSVSFGKSDPVSGKSDGTVSFSPASGLADGKYEAVVLVTGTKSDGKTANPDAVGQADYFFYINGAAPASLHVGLPIANNTNSSSFPFEGQAAPGLDVKVTVPDSGTPGGLNDASATGTVPLCGQALCDWTVNVDISGLSDNDNQTWSAQTFDKGSTTNKGGKADGPTFRLDQSAPSAPNQTKPTDGSTVQTSVPVAANYGAGSAPSDLAGFHVTITDPEDNVVEQFFAASPASPSFDQTVDVSTLDDGDLTVDVRAQDTAGNLSSRSPINPAPTVHKVTPLLPNLATSSFDFGNSTTSLTEAETTPVRSPHSLTVKFTQTIKTSYTDNNPPPSTHNASLCIATTAGNCVTSTGPTLTDDERGLTIAVPNTLPDRQYIIKVTAFSKNSCPNVNPGSHDNCDKYSQILADPATGQTFTFTVDDTPPTVSNVTVTPDPIRPDDVASVNISGTADGDTQSVKLLLKSTGGKGAQFATATVGTPANGSVTWTADGLDLSALPDGTLKVTVTAKDAAGNSGKGHGSAKLAAHASKLTESSSPAKTSYGKTAAVGGRLTDQFGEPIVSATITVQQKFSNGDLGEPSTATTDSKGRWSLLQTVTENARFVASYAGTTTSPVHDPATTRHASIKVHAGVDITSPKDGAKASSPVTVKGTALPAAKGRVVKLYLKTGGGKTLVGKDATNHRGRFVIKAKLPKGHDTIFAKVGKSATNLAGKSQPITVKAT